MNITTEMVSGMRPEDAEKLHGLLFELERFLIDEEGPEWREVFHEVARVRQGIVAPQVTLDIDDINNRFGRIEALETTLAHVRAIKKLGETDEC